MIDLTFWNQLECIDLSVPLSEEFPLNWPTLPQFRKGILNWFEDLELPNGETLRSHGYYYDQYLDLDEHTGTHVDFPLHVLPPEELQAGKDHRSADVPLKNFAGPAIKIDARAYLDRASAGESPRIPASVLDEWESIHGSVAPAHIALIDTGFIDKYFKRFPEGMRLMHDPVIGRNVPGWPVPGDDLLQKMAQRGVRHVGLSSPSIGALDDGHGPHRTGIELGMTFAEFLIGLDRVPPKGAIYVGLPLRIIQQSGSPVRAVAFVPEQSTS